MMSWRSFTRSSRTRPCTVTTRSSTHRRGMCCAGSSRRWRMRRRYESSGGPDDFPVYPIGPVLETFGGQPVVEGYGWKPYRCPFHKDSDASASVNTQKQVFNCHASGDCPSGNAVQVIKEWEGLTYREAVQRAAEISGESVGNVRSPSGRGR